MPFKQFHEKKVIIMFLFLLAAFLAMPVFSSADAAALEAVTGGNFPAPPINEMTVGITAPTSSLLAPKPVSATAAAPIALSTSASAANPVSTSAAAPNALTAPAAVPVTAPVSVTFPAGPGPEFLKAEVQGVKVLLTWDRAGKKDTTFNIYRSISPDKDFLKINKEDVKQAGYTDERAASLIAPQSGTLYYYRVTSVDSGVESLDSKTVLATPFAPLGPPNQVTVLPGFSSVKIKWAEPEASGNFGISGYNIFRSTVSGALTQLNPVTITVFEYDDAGLTNGAKYDYALQSIDAMGNTSAISDVYSAVPFSAISSPKNLTTTGASSESIKLVWDAPDGVGTYGISGYNIFRSTVPGFFPEQPVNLKLAKGFKSEDNRLFYFDNLVNSSDKPKIGDKYFYKIVPVDFRGNTGSASDVVPGAVPIMEVSHQGIISADISEYGLPPESRLTLSGRKSLGLEYSHIWWKDNTTATKENFDIKQKLKLTLKGNIGTKINVDVNYDEDTLTDEYTKISISYTGAKDETLQEVSFGDLTLDLPSTKYLSYAPQKLFGLRGKAKIGDKLTITALAAQTKGINDTQVFVGTLRKKQVNSRNGIDIFDTAYLKNTYYYITKDPTVKIVPGSLIVYRDDAIIANVDVNTISSIPVTPGAPPKYHFKQLYAGVDFLVDYTTNIIKFNTGIGDNYILAVGYKTNDNQNIGLTPGGTFDFHEANLNSEPHGITDKNDTLIQNGVTGNQIDLSHKVLGYYYMGETKINNPVTDTGGFKILITSTDGTQPVNVPQPWEVNASDYYTIDTDFGILKFKAPFPFAANNVLKNTYNDPSTEENATDAYKIVGPVSLYKIHLEYNFQVSSYKLDNFPVVFGSEHVLVGGVAMKKDVNYDINYDAGEITFNKSVVIGDSTEVRVTYEYLPFVGANASNLFGGRIDYDLLDNLKLAVTGLYKMSSSGTTTPGANSTETSLTTPFNSLVVDGTANLDLNRENVNKIINALPLMSGSDVPVDFKFSAETAYSDLNPNAYQKTLTSGKVENGPAMIDDMESANIETSATMLSASWFPASQPVLTPPSTYLDRAFIVRSDVTDIGSQPTTPGSLTPDQKKMLKLEYSNLTSQKWDSFRYVLSTSGMNLNQYNTLEISVKVKTSQPVRMSVDVGVISEDSNGTGVFAYNSKGIADGESEDNNPPTGVLTTGSANKDIGISPGIYNTLSGSTPAYWGAGNIALDTEDMNQNGIIDQEEAYYRFDSEGPPSLTIPLNIPQPKLLLVNGDNWVDIKIPLSDYTYLVGGVANNNVGVNKDKYMSFIKHLRINLKGSNGQPAEGNIEIEFIKFTGNSWSLQTPQGEYDRAGNPVIVDSTKLNISSINKKAPDTDNYTPNLDYYDWTTDTDKLSETSLKITSNISNLDQGISDGQPLYYATKLLNSSGGYDYHPYKYLKMDVYFRKWDPTAGNGRVMFIRVGSSDDPTYPRYYQYNVQISELAQNTSSWQTVVFALDGSDGRRSSSALVPNLRVVQYISIGFINPNSTPANEIMWVDNIRLTDAQSSTGQSTFLSSTMNINGVGTLAHSYEDKEATFYTLADAGRADIKQHEQTTNLSFGYSQLPFLPITTSYFKYGRFFDGPNKNDPTYTQDNTIYDLYSEGFTNNLSFSLIPDLTLSNGTTVRSDVTEYPGDGAWQNNTRKSMDFKPMLSWKAPANFFFIPLGSNNFDANITFDNYETAYTDLAVSPTVTGSYYYNWQMNRRQDYKWTGSYAFLGLSLQPTYEFVLREQTGYLTSKYVFYQNSITDPQNKVDRYYVMGRDIMPHLSLSYPSLWIFSPTLTYGEESHMDYTQSFLDNHGRLDASTAVNLNKLVGWLPNISRYAFSIESTQHYEDINYPGSFYLYDTMPLESRWNIFMWRLLYDEHEIRRFETSAKNGAFIISHNLNLDEINIASLFYFTPAFTYSLNRTFSSQGAVRSFSESFTLSAPTIRISGVTIPLPFLQDLVTNQTLTGSYSYARNFTKGVDKQITEDDLTNTFSLSLPYTAKSGVNGVLSLTGSRKDTIQFNYRSWTGTLGPSLKLNYSYKQSDPITFPSWLWLLGDKTFRMDQNLDLTGTLGVNYNLGGDNDKNVNEANSKEYTLSTSAAYKILQNLTATLTLTYGHKDDSWHKDQEYDKFTISLGAVIEF